MFACEICDMDFVRSCNLNRHLSIHELESQCFCEHCDFNSKRKDSLKRHVARYHPFSRNVQLPQTQEETCDISISPSKQTQFDKTTDSDKKLQLPNNFVYAGSTQSGKTTLLMKTLENAHKMYNPVPNKVVFLYSCWQNMYNKLRDSLLGQGIKIEFRQEGIITKDDLEAMADPNGGQTVIIIDDNSTTASENKDVVDAFTKARHNKCSIVLLLHFIFGSQNLAKIRANTGYYFLLKSCENAQQVALLGSKMGLKNALIRAYEQESRKAYGYVLIDRRTVTPSHQRIRLNIFEELLGNQPEDKQLVEAALVASDAADEKAPKAPDELEPHVKKTKWLKRNPKLPRKTEVKSKKKKKQKILPRFKPKSMFKRPWSWR